VKVKERRKRMNWEERVAQGSNLPVGHCGCLILWETGEGWTGERKI
jgi:hypothetical protein